MWHVRDEGARDLEVLHPQWGVLYKSPAYAPKAIGPTPGGLPGLSRQETRLGEGRPEPNDRQESAEGKVGGSSGKASEALQSRKAESTDRPRRKAATEGRNR